MWYFRQLREIQKKWYLRWAFLLKYAEKLVHLKLNIAEGALRNNITEIRQISNIISYICLTLRYIDPDFLFAFLSYLN